MEDSASTPEQLTLVGFAARLGTSISAEDGIANDGDLRKQAQLLMHLMSSSPTQTSPLEEEISLPTPFFDEEPSFVQPTTTATEQNTFNFTCPSLSLDDGAYRSSRLPLRKRAGSEGSEDSVPSLVDPPSPSDLLARPLTTDDRNAIRLSAEAMARNILQSFNKALRWRSDSWIATLSEALVRQERELASQGATEEQIKELLQTREAFVIASIRQATAQISPLEVSTTFEVLPQRVDMSEKPPNGSPPPKKRKMPQIVQTKYSVEHALLFNAILGFMTPSGYAEITLQAPGKIEGSFLRCGPGDEMLVGAGIELGVDILTAMIEKSSRIIVRSSAQALIEPSIKSLEQQQQEVVSTEEGEEIAKHLATPQPSKTKDLPLPLAIISPRESSPASDDNESELEIVEQTKCIPIPDNFSSIEYKRAALRMVSPQPRSPEQSGAPFYSPATPTIPSKLTGPSLVSPPLSKSEHGGSTTQYLSFDSTGPKLPALLEVACAAMRSC